MEFHAGVAEYIIYLLIEAVALVGVVRLLLQKQTDADFESPAFDRGAFYLLALLALLAVGEIVSFNLKISSPQGRYLYMAIIPISVALAAGFLKMIEPNHRRAAALSVRVLLCVLCVHLLYFYWFVKY
jgi:hypothetical protein